MEDWQSAVDGLMFWDQFLMQSAKSFGEYRTLRRARLAGPEGAVMWCVQKRIQPDD